MIVIQLLIKAMQILKIITAKTEYILLLIGGLIGLLLFGRNSKLSSQNKRLNAKLEASHEVMKKQKKVINVRKNTKPTDIDGNIKRMRQNKL